MTIIRTNGTFADDGGGLGSVTIPGRPVRKRFKTQNQNSNPLDVVFASGFGWKNLPPNWMVNEPWGEGMQGAVTLTGTAGDTYDVEEEV